MRTDRALGAARIGPSFDALLAAARSGAPWALERIYRAMSPAVLGYLRVQGAPDPEDLANEVFLGVLTRIGSFAGTEAGLRSWVFTVAHSRLVDERRRTNRRPPIDQAATAGDSRACEATGGDVEEEALRAVSAERVRSLCHRLPPDQRDVLLLRLMAGLTIEEIAQALGRSLGAVKALQRRGLANLRRILEVEAVPL